MKVTAVIERLAKCDSLRLGFSSGQRRWWFEGPYQVVPEHIVHAAVRDGAVAVIEAGDSLFGFKGNSQTWLVEERSDCLPVEAGTLGRMGDARTLEE